MLAFAAMGFPHSPQQKQQPAASKEDITRSELATFDQLLDKHPEFRRDLAKNPSLINDKKYLWDHPVLADFLKNHPAVRAEISGNPQEFMNRERQFEQHERSDHPGPGRPQS